MTKPDEIERVARAFCDAVSSDERGHAIGPMKDGLYYYAGQTIDIRAGITAAIAAMDTRLREQVAAKDAQLAEYEALWQQIEAFAEGRIKICRTLNTPEGGK